MKSSGSTATSATVSVAATGPGIAIISPVAGSKISGMMFFAVQPFDPTAVSKVTFCAGTNVVGIDTTANDGFRIFLDTDTLPAGPVQLLALAEGPGGQRLDTILVDVVSNPPSTATIGSEGGVLASEIGSIITFPPGAAADGTDVSITEKTQQEITIATGFDWDTMGVTFLGAQVMTASAPISLPLGVASAGFGPRVQPGQVVVNYSILPDANGDGVDELVVVNTASVAPNDDVISDPVPQPALVSRETSSSALNFHNLQNGISGPPGTFFQVEATGFNRFSAFGNVAVVRSSVDGTEFQMPVIFIDDFQVDEIQTLLTIIPSIPPGPATLTLHNASTGSSIGPFDITVEVPPPLTKPAEEIIDDFLVLASQNLDNLANELAGEPAFASVITLIDSAKAGLVEARSRTQAMSSDAEAVDLLVSMATVIENGVPPSNIFGLNSRQDIQGAGLCDNKEQLLEMVKPAITDAINLNEIGAEALDYAAKRSYGAAFGAGSAYGFVSALDALAMTTVMTLIIMDCQLYGPRPPQSIYSSPLFFEGMGATPPLGGSGAGNVLMPPASGGGTSRLSLQNSLIDRIPGRVIVKVASTGGGGFPFSGATDAGGYFFIPLIPQGEPFVATAIDSVTGQMRTFEDTGPPIGQSIIMAFDFSSGDTGGITELQFGEVISASIDSPTEVDTYSFQGTAGDQVLFRMKSLGGDHNPAFELFDPNGTLVCSNPPVGINFREATCALNSTGTFTLLYSSYVSVGTGPYQLYLQRLNAPAGAVAANFGQTETGTIDIQLELDTYSFDGVAGDRILARMSRIAAGLNPEFAIYRPDGTLLCEQRGPSSGQVEKECLLDATGTYTLLAGDWVAQFTAPYALYVQRLNNPGNTVPISFGDTVSGTIEPQVKIDTYLFDGLTGDQALSRMVSTSSTGTVAFWPKISVYRPDGTLLCTTFGSQLAEQLCELDGNETYTILAGNQQGAGTYNLLLQRTNNPVNVTPLSYGETITDTINAPVELDAYQFNGTIGDQVLTEITSIALSIDPLFDMYRPDGTLLCSAQSGGTLATATCVLDANGSHTILVGDVGGNDTGTYTVFIDRVN
jgi:hypothetical protein